MILAAKSRNCPAIVTAEAIAKTAASRMRGYLESTAFAGPYLADQLLVPFALAGGGEITTVKPREHTTTAVGLIERFPERRISIDKISDIHLVADRC